MKLNSIKHDWIQPILVRCNALKRPQCERFKQTNTFFKRSVPEKRFEIIINKIKIIY